MKPLVEKRVKVLMGFIFEWGLQEAFLDALLEEKKKRQASPNRAALDAIPPKRKVRVEPTAHERERTAELRKWVQDQERRQQELDAAAEKEAGGKK